MSKISVRVQLVYTDQHAIPSTYNIDWDSDRRDFESFMFDLMNTLVTLEDKNTFDKVDILGIDVIEGTAEEKKAVKAFKKEHDII